MLHDILSEDLPIGDEETQRMESEFHKILAGVGVSSLPDIRLKAEGKHLIFTDGDKVLIKMSRLGHNDRRLMTELSVGNTGNDAIRRSLFREVLETKGRKFIVSEYVSGTPVVSSSATAKNGELLAETLVQIHSTPVTNTIRTRLNSLLDLPHQVNHRITIQRGLSDVSRLGLRELVRNNIEDLHSSTRDLPRALTHGDAHSNNFILSADETSGKWIDLEKAKLAPVEWDVAALRYSLQEKGGNADAWAAAEAVFKDNYPDIDEYIVDRFEGAIYLIRSISDIWNNRVENSEEVAQSVLDYAAQ